MSLITDWWKQTTKTEKYVQVVTFLLFFSITCDEFSTALVSITTGMAWLFIIYDCIKTKSLRGFYLAKQKWMGLAVFLGAVLLASVLSGDQKSIEIAVKYIWWVHPFILMIYLSKKAEIKYAAVLGALVSVLVSSADMVYLYGLYLQKHKLPLFAPNIRIGAFSKNPTIWGTMLAGTLPFLLYSLNDQKIKACKKFVLLHVSIVVFGVWALWITGSRGAMAGILAGAMIVFGIEYYKTRNTRLFSVSAALCAAAAVAFLLVGIPNGYVRMNGDGMRLHLLKTSYAMWNDHKLLGVGLANWRTRYTASYYSYSLNKDNIQNTALQRYARIKKIKIEEIPEKTRTAIMKSAMQPYAGLGHPHNTIAWFFTTTGILGGAGYLFFLLQYGYLLLRNIREHPEEWIFGAVLWVYLALGVHGMVDAGITHKGAARLLYLMLGLALCYGCYQKREELPDN